MWGPRSGRSESGGSAKRGAPISDQRALRGSPFLVDALQKFVLLFMIVLLV